MRPFVGAALILALAAPSRGDVASDLATGLRQVEQGDFEAAVVILDSVVGRLRKEGGREAERRLAHLYLGTAYLGLGQSTKARIALREAWRLEPGAALDASRFPAALVEMYADVDREGLGPPDPFGAMQRGGLIAILAGYTMCTRWRRNVDQGAEVGKQPRPSYPTVLCR